jgi:hypothetical protein
MMQSPYEQRASIPALKLLRFESSFSKTGLKLAAFASILEEKGV